MFIAFISALLMLAAVKISRVNVAWIQKVDALITGGVCLFYCFLLNHRVQIELFLTSMT